MADLDLVLGAKKVKGAAGSELGDFLASEMHARYYSLCRQGRLFIAHAIVAAPVIYSTAAGTGGPLIWNNSPLNVVLLAVGFGVTVVTTVAAALGITGGVGQTAAPTTATAIDSNRNLFIGGPLPLSTAYRIGTVANAGNFLLPFGDLDTGALTTSFGGMNWIDLGGCVICPPQAWVSVAASATATTTAVTIGLVYAEVPV